MFSTDTHSKSSFIMTHLAFVLNNIKNSSFSSTLLPRRFSRDCKHDTQNWWCLHWSLPTSAAFLCLHNTIILFLVYFAIKSRTSPSGLPSRAKLISDFFFDVSLRYRFAYIKNLDVDKWRVGLGESLFKAALGHPLIHFESTALFRLLVLHHHQYPAIWKEKSEII